jgi:mRNA interferase YafQ
MRTISRTRSFKRDYKREKSAQHGSKLDDLLRAVLEPLIADQPLPIQYRDHALSGEWAKGGYRDCHIRPDLVLIYRKPDANTLELVRLGSHSELSL